MWTAWLKGMNILVKAAASVRQGDWGLAAQAYMAFSSTHESKRASGVCRLQRAATKAAALKATNLSRTVSFFPEVDTASLPASEQDPATFSPRALSHAHTGTDYEFGKAYDKQDADRYFGGLYLYVRAVTIPSTLQFHCAPGCNLLC